MLRPWPLFTILVAILVHSPTTILVLPAMTVNVQSRSYCNPMCSLVSSARAVFTQSCLAVYCTLALTILLQSYILRNQTPVLLQSCIFGQEIQKSDHNPTHLAGLGLSIQVLIPSPLKVYLKFHLTRSYTSLWMPFLDEEVTPAKGRDTSLKLTPVKQEQPHVKPVKAVNDPLLIHCFPLEDDPSARPQTAF